MDNSTLAEVKQAIRISVIVSYFITFVIGVFGNGLVVFIIGRYRQIRTTSVHNYYIWNLAYADLFYTLTLPFYCYATITSDWQFGDFGCKLALVLKETNRFASVFTLVALSFDRYLASIYNSSKWRTTKVGVIVCITIWLLCGIISIPFWMFSRVRLFGENRQCILWWPEKQSFSLGTFWTYFQVLVALVLPFIAISVSYTLLFRNLRRMFRYSAARSRASGSAGALVNGSGSSRANTSSGPGGNITRTVLVVVLVFLVCQTPYHAVEIMSMNYYQAFIKYKHQPTDREQIEFMILNTIAQILVFLSSCCNPVIYGLMNDNYREYI